MNKSKLKILLLADAASFHTERFYLELQSQGCEVLLASLESGIPSAITLTKIGFVKQLHYRFAVPQIKKLIREFKPDIISVHFASGYGHIAALANKNRNIPLALNLWGSDILIVPHKSIFHNYKTRYALKNSQYVFADSQYLIDSAKSIYPFSSCKVIPWGVEKSIFDLHKKDFTLSQPLKIIVPRAHEKVYNNLFIVQALRNLINEDKIQITFPTFGSLYDSFKKKCKLLVGNKIRFYKKSKRPQFLKLVSEHEVYLSASLSDSSPVSLIEAMAIGLVPVVMNIDGVKEWIANDNGYLFAQDHTSLANVIEQLLDSTKNFTLMRKNNLQQVKDNALFEKNIAGQIKIFTSLVETSK